VSHDSPLVRLAAFALLVLTPVASADDAKTGWMEVKTKHVTVKTDLSHKDAVRAAVLAEQTRAALLAAAWPGSRLDQDRIELIVFSNHQEFERYFGDFVTDKVVLGDYPPTVFLYGAPDRWERRVTLELEGTVSVLKEALAQHLSTFFYRRQPRWFSIGLAEFLETLRVAEDGKTATLGIPNLQAMNDYGTHRSINVADALAWGTTLNPTDEGTLLGLRGLSWLMVVWVYNTHLPEFVRFQKLLITGLDPAKSWKVVFPTLVLGDLDQELNHFLRYGSQGISTVSIPQGDEVTLDSERTLSSAEVHALRAEAALAAGHAKDAPAELSAALADDPSNVAALRQQMPLVKPAERLALARRATAVHPEDGLAWLMLGDALREGGGSPEECAQAYRKTIELLPDHPAAFNALATLDLKKGAPALALPQAQAAVRMAPWDAVMLETLASALAGVGRCGEAAATEARAMDMASEKSGPAKRAEYASRLAEIQKTCTEAPATPTEPAAPAPSAPKP
jgi:tetratricopeptide (TPR) repeat protein